MRRFVPLLVVLAIVVTFIETAFIHALSHLGLAYLLGIPVFQFSWIDPVLKVPSVYFDVAGGSGGRQTDRDTLCEHPVARLSQRL